MEQKLAAAESHLLPRRKELLENEAKTERARAGDGEREVSDVTL